MHPLSVQDAYYYSFQGSMSTHPFYEHRYDDLKTAQENIDLQSTILSRFDLIFIVKAS